MNLGMRWVYTVFALTALGCGASETGSQTPWRLSEASQGLVDAAEANRIFKALDAAREVGTDPSISKYQVRAATVVEMDGKEHVIIGGNSEYEVPEAIHAETSVLNHVANRLGAEATRRVRFLAFFKDDRCGSGMSCGDCRDYQVATTDAENLLVVCGQASDQTVHIRRFSEALVSEGDFPLVDEADLPLSPEELQRLVEAADFARSKGVTLFTSSRDHAGAAALSSQGKLYRAAGADDAAFHYRYPIGGVLQQAASEGDYFLRYILVVGEKGSWPRISYRDRQYGYESSSFNLKRGLEPIRLILSDGQGQYRLTTFEEALPHAFSTAAFMPEAVESFLQSHAP